ncbi:hydroxyproline-rich glycoprotein family protein [Raphanus sativus]|uniref:Uncharacterized protein LOC108860708 n=1 Tax=Raphanus sativus TaxID=3726 RepID=A0A6J0P0N4_RAPSA|nr:uncharacterized protein LOC108860708 [Raphanus sativus]KAJ4896578.1 hydroxyproline-rich glycoprotein family protein [Raphanus sativus]
MDGIGGNQRRRASWEDDQITSNQRRRTNPALMVTDEPPQNDGVQSQVWEDDRVVVAMNEPPRNDVVVVQTGDDDDNDAARLLPLSLSLRQPTPYSSSQIASSPTPLRLAPPSPVAPMQTWSPRYLMARFPPSYQPYFATTSPPPSYLLPSSFSYSPYQTLSRGPSAPIHPPPPPYAPPFDFLTPAVRPVSSSALVVESRRSYRSQSNRNNRKDDDTIPPPYPWATSKRGAIQSLENLESKQITTITGNVQCKHCEKVYQMSYDLREKFSEVVSVFASLKRLMRERAPAFWTNPEPMRCELCGRDKAVKPVIAQRKSQINWLFLLLGQMLGYCTLEQLKNFCKHSKSHRTGAKDRVLYLTYLGLCKMLEPDSELFNRGGR